MSQVNFITSVNGNAVAIQQSDAEEKSAFFFNVTSDKYLSVFNGQKTV